MKKDRLHSLQEVLKEEMTDERLDSISEYGQDIGAQASKLKTVIVNMTDDIQEERRRSRSSSTGSRTWRSYRGWSGRTTV